MQPLPQTCFLASIAPTTRHPRDWTMRSFFVSSGRSTQVRPSTAAGSQHADDLDQSSAQCVEAVFEAAAARVHDRAPGLYAPRGCSRHAPVAHLGQKCCFLRSAASRAVAGDSRRRGPHICRSQAAAHGRASLCHRCGSWCWVRLRSECAPCPGGQQSSGTWR